MQFSSLAPKFQVAISRRVSLFPFGISTLSVPKLVYDTDFGAKSFRRIT